MKDKKFIPFWMEKDKIEIIEKHKDYETEGLLAEETIDLLNILRGEDNE